MMSIVAVLNVGLLVLVLLSVGTLVESRCKDSNGRRIRKGQTSKDDSFIYQCVEETPGDFFMKSIGCIFKGRELRRGQESRDEYYVYQCKQDRSGMVSVEIVACVDPKGQRVERDGVVSREGYAWKCSASRWGSLSLTPFGCEQDGMIAAVGDTFEGSNFWYACTNSNGTPTKEIKGCVSRGGKRIQPGQFFIKNKSYVQCKCTPQSCKNQVVGCVQRLPNGRVKGQFVWSEWIEGVAPFQFKVKCKLCSAGITIYKTNSECRIDEAGTKLSAGCMRRVGRSILACGVDTSKRLKVYTRPNRQQAIRKLRAKKFRFC